MRAGQQPPKHHDTQVASWRGTARHPRSAPDRSPHRVAPKRANARRPHGAPSSGESGIPASTGFPRRELPIRGPRKLLLPGLQLSVNGLTSPPRSSPRGSLREQRPPRGGSGRARAGAAADGAAPAPQRAGSARLCSALLGAARPGWAGQTLPSCLPVSARDPGARQGRGTAGQRRAGGGPGSAARAGAPAAGAQRRPLTARVFSRQGARLALGRSAGPARTVPGAAGEAVPAAAGAGGRAFGCAGFGCCQFSTQSTAGAPSPP